MQNQRELKKNRFFFSPKTTFLNAVVLKRWTFAVDEWTDRLAAFSPVSDCDSASVLISSDRFNSISSSEVMKNQLVLCLYKVSFISFASKNNILTQESRISHGRSKMKWYLFHCNCVKIGKISFINKLYLIIMTPARCWEGRCNLL